VRDHLTEFGDVEIAVVTFAAPSQLANYREHVAVPFLILADPERRVYAQFAIRRGALRNIWTLGTVRLYVRLLRQGRELRQTRSRSRFLLKQSS